MEHETQKSAENTEVQQGGNGKAEIQDAEEAKEAKEVVTAVTVYKSKMGETLREEIIRVMQTGDPDKGGAFTPNVAARVERMLHAGREILLAEQVPLDGLKSVLKRRKNGPSIVSAGGFGIMGQSLSDMDDYGMLEPEGGPLAQSGPAENFGMTAIRELISGLNNNQDSPEKLVKALALARLEGLDDVTATLEKKLGVEKKQEAEGTIKQDGVKQDGEALP